MKKILQYILFLMCSASYSQIVSLDESFNTTQFQQGRRVVDILTQPDGKILVAGNFTSYNGVEHNSLLRLNIDGSLDTTFDPGMSTGLNGQYYITSLAMDSFGKIYVGGNFNNFNGSSKKGVVRLNADGSVDPTFTFDFFSPNSQASVVYDLAFDSSGKLLIAGNFWTTTPSWGSATGLMRVNYDGSYDNSFTRIAGDNDVIFKVLVQPDGKVLIGGYFNISTAPNDADGLARLNADGTLDVSFLSENDVFGFIYDIYVDSNNKIILGGLFKKSFFSNQWNILARFNDSGSVDDSFNAFEVGFLSTSNNVVYSIKPYGSDILIGGRIPYYNGNPAGDLMLIGENGIADTSFDIGEGFESLSGAAEINCITTQDDGKIIAGGYFSSYNGSTVHGLARLLPSNLGLEVPESSQFSTIVFSENSVVHFNASNDISQIIVYDTLGREVLYKKGIFNKECLIDNLPAQQVLIAKVTFTNQTVQSIKLLN
ncbi:hypothetical protein AAEO56_17440 [Flavobacterium sp. DGU11]|uniref:Delta-60 repeat domain-containing protein n=1 Tax=Flavobacterium arundinis TaxID=3139143 RepID=A0ABU9I0V5_9FLAO